jgi:hypothetical protein
VVVAVHAGHLPRLALAGPAAAATAANVTAQHPRQAQQIQVVAAAAQELLSQVQVPTVVAA